MTREGLIKHWETIQAFKGGEEIQRFSRVSEYWVHETEPTFNCDTEYRIKPKPKLVPFDFSDGQRLIIRPVKNKNQNLIGMITQVDDDGVTVGGNLFSTFEDLLDDWTFSDGSPCGKLKS